HQLEGPQRPLDRGEPKGHSAPDFQRRLVRLGIYSRLMWLALLTSKWTWIAIAFAALTAWGAFWKWDAGRWETKYETYAAQVRAAGLVAEAKAKEKEAAQEKATKEVKA